MQEHLRFLSKVSLIVEDLKLLSNDYTEKIFDGVPITTLNSFGKVFMDLIGNYGIKFFECSFSKYGLTLKIYYVYNLRHSQKIYEIMFEIYSYFSNKLIIFALKLSLVETKTTLAYKSSQIKISSKSDNYYPKNYFEIGPPNIIDHNFDDFIDFCEFIVSPDFDTKIVNICYNNVSTNFSEMISSINFELLQNIFLGPLSDGDQFAHILFLIFQQSHVKSARLKF